MNAFETWWEKNKVRFLPFEAPESVVRAAAVAAWQAGYDRGIEQGEKSGYREGYNDGTCTAGHYT